MESSNSTVVATLDRAKAGEEAKRAAKTSGPLAFAAAAPLDEARAFAWATGIKQLEGLVRRIIALEEQVKSLQQQARNSGTPHLAAVERR